MGSHRQVVFRMRSGKFFFSWSLSSLYHFKSDLIVEFQLYPLFGDVGIDGVSLYSSGPPRTLRPITKALWEAWDGWPQFRDIMVKNGLGDYTSVGIQHIFLPDSTRYLSDRFLSVNVTVPPVETILRISPRELLPALQSVFPLDTFEVSFLPQAIRSFIHHFYPAYSSMWTDYLKLLESQSNRPTPGP